MEFVFLLPSRPPHRRPGGSEAAGFAQALGSFELAVAVARTAGLRSACVLCGVSRVVGRASQRPLKFTGKFLIYE